MAGQSCKHLFSAGHSKGVLELQLFSGQIQSFHAHSRVESWKPLAARVAVSQWSIWVFSHSLTGVWRAEKIGQLQYYGCSAAIIKTNHTLSSFALFCNTHAHFQLTTEWTHLHWCSPVQKLITLIYGTCYRTYVWVFIAITGDKEARVQSLVTKEPECKIRRHIWLAKNNTIHPTAPVWAQRLPISLWDFIWRF